MSTIYDVDVDSLKIILEDIHRRNKGMYDKFVNALEEDENLPSQVRANYGGAIVGLSKLYMDYQAIMEELTGGPVGGQALEEVNNFLNNILIDMRLRGYNIEATQQYDEEALADEQARTEEDLDRGGP